MTGRTSDLGVEAWWDALRGASLVGTARREVPVLPAVLGAYAGAGQAGREQALLEAAALGDAVRRAGSVARQVATTETAAPVETLAAAPSPAVQILELLLTQVPVGAAARDLLVEHWVATATARQRIVPPRLLPPLLRLGAERSASMRAAIAAAAGERGRWLAERNPEWAWLATRPEEDDPDLDVRDPIAATWSTAGAQERAALVAGLVAGLSPGDEPFLEACLDDRARPVREAAQRLLDRLPSSARAARMGERLRALLTYTGRKGSSRGRLDVALPDDPDPAAVRDGLVAPKGVGSVRAFRRDGIVRGAPLEVWTDAVGGDPARVVALLRGMDDSLLAALTDAAAGRGDQAWARALLDLRHDTRLIAVLPDGERDRLLAARVARETLARSAHELHQAPRPWGPRLSAAVMTAVTREKDAGHGVRLLRDILPLALHPDSLGAVERVLRSQRDEPDTAQLRTVLRDVLQYQSLHRSISEAFR